MRLSFAFLLATSFLYSGESPPTHKKQIGIIQSPPLKLMLDSASVMTRLHTKAVEARQFLSTRNLNREVCFFIDMHEASGRNRFFAYDLNKDSALLAGLVTQGHCNLISFRREYSNEPGSACTSLGRYRIGVRYHGQFGLAYKLHGYDSTNSNVFKRYVVLHAHDCVPEHEIYPEELCQSAGCPTVSHNFLRKLSATIDNSARPVLLWIYD